MLFGHPYANDETICAKNCLQKHLGKGKRKAEGTIHIDKNSFIICDLIRQKPTEFTTNCLHVR